MEESAALAQLARRLEEVVNDLRGLPVDVERLVDSELVRQRISQAAASATELRAMQPVGQAGTERDERSTRRENLDALERGMRMRTIVHADMLDKPLLAARIRQLHAAGDLHRVVDEPIQQMVIFDRTVAFLRIVPVAHSPERW
ncbi:hypothetical protein ACFQQB_69760 [Nonomuraea rubra]|uniref:hypothetical protein n=1 Tax=Nonomuraea rubra TaxID=46180 RepID=UPI0036085025